MIIPESTKVYGNLEIWTEASITSAGVGSFKTIEVGTSGIKFPSDAFGGGGDTAGMRLVSKGGEAQSLEIYTTNDADDWVNLSVPDVNAAKINGYTIWNHGNFEPANYSLSGHIHDDRYYTESETNSLLSGKSDVGHIHDDRYYTESEINSLLSGKQNSISKTVFEATYGSGTSTAGWCKLGTYAGNSTSRFIFTITGKTGWNDQNFASQAIIHGGTNYIASDVGQIAAGCKWNEFAGSSETASQIRLVRQSGYNPYTFDLYILNDNNYVNWTVDVTHQSCSWTTDIEWQQADPGTGTHVFQPTKRTVWETSNFDPSTKSDVGHTHSIVNITDRASGYVDDINDVGTAKYMRWKNYGDGHEIIDASNSTAPNGATISNTDPDNIWQSTYPTLMGWNGNTTYGVRVDRSRYSDNADYLNGIQSNRIVYGDNESATTRTSGVFANITKSGFYNNDSSTDAPVPSTWAHVIHSDYTGDNNWAWQLAANFEASNSEDYWTRIKVNGTFKDWRKIWTSKDISQTNINNWNTSYTSAHNHSNKSNLDTINQDLGTGYSPSFAGLTVGNISNTEFSYLDGVSGNIQTQLNQLSQLAVSGSGAGTINKLTKFVTSSSMGDSSITDDGSLVTFGTQITVPRINLPNGTQSLYVGDDASIGDVNIGHTIGVKSQTDTTLGYVKFGNDSNGLGYNGSYLTYTGSMSFGPAGTKSPNSYSKYVFNVGDNDYNGIDIFAERSDKSVFISLGTQSNSNSTWGIQKRDDGAYGTTSGCFSIEDGSASFAVERFPITVVAGDGGSILLNRNIDVNSGKKISVVKDVNPSVGNDPWMDAPILINRASTNGSDTSNVAGIGFHNQGVNASLFYYDPATSQFKYRRHSGGTTQTFWDSGNFNPNNYSLSGHNHDSLYLKKSDTFGGSDGYDFTLESGSNTGGLCLNLRDDSDGSEYFVVRNNAGNSSIIMKSDRTVNIGYQFYQQTKPILEITDGQYGIGANSGYLDLYSAGGGFRAFSKSGSSDAVFLGDFWHTGNFNPGSYLPLTGGNLTGPLTVSGNAVWDVGDFTQTDVDNWDTAYDRVIFSNLATNCFQNNDSDTWLTRMNARGNHFGRYDNSSNGSPRYLNYTMLRETAGTVYGILGYSSDGEWYAGKAAYDAEITNYYKIWTTKDISQSNIDNWNLAYTSAHNHANKSNLDTINQNLGTGYSPTFTGATIRSSFGRMSLESTTTEGAYLSQIGTGNGTDQNVWDSFVQGPILKFRTVNDAYNAASSWLEISRSGATPTDALFNVTVTAPKINLIANSAQIYDGSNVPPYYIGQAMANNDGWRIYGEGTDNNGRLVLEVNDDSDEGLVFKQRKTYAPYTTNTHTIWHSGNFDPSSKSEVGHIHDDRYYTESETNSLLNNYLPLSGGTMTGNITFTGSDEGVIFRNNSKVGTIGGILALRMEESNTNPRLLSNDETLSWSILTTRNVTTTMNYIPKFVGTGVNSVQMQNSLISDDGTNVTCNGSIIIPGEGKGIILPSQNEFAPNAKFVNESPNTTHPASLQLYNDATEQTVWRVYAQQSGPTDTGFGANTIFNIYAPTVFEEEVTINTLTNGSWSNGNIKSLSTQSINAQQTLNAGIAIVGLSGWAMPSPSVGAVLRVMGEDTPGDPVTNNLILTSNSLTVRGISHNGVYFEETISLDMKGRCVEFVGKSSNEWQIVGTAPWTY